MNFKNKKVAVLGWGINGLDICKYLLKTGADITIFDKKEASELDFSGIDIRKVRFILGSKYLEKGLANYDFIFRAPGVYRYLPEIIDAEIKGSVITSVTKLFFDLCPAKIIGVTGTKGKGTTSTLIYEILKNDGKEVYLAGNIGAPIMELLPKLKPSSWVVLEMSSFQLIDLTKSPHIAVILNITEDHLDWHKDRSEYVTAKTHLVRYQNNKDYCVLAYDYKDSGNFSKLTKGSVFYFSNSKKVKGSYVEDGKIKLEVGKMIKTIGNTNKLPLLGKHNQENVCAAVCASYLSGSSINSIKQSVFKFKGLEHRLESVGEVKGVKFYNDSFSTNPQTTIAAIKSFSVPLTIILGGSDKELRYEEMSKVIADGSIVKNIALIGDIAGIIKKSLNKSGYKGEIHELGYQNMVSIVKYCREITQTGGVVLLSPATASFDMFKDYKERGGKFKEAVESLKRKS